MRFLITLIVLALLGSPAFAKSKAAAQAPSLFTGKLLSYEQLIALPKEKRMSYLKSMVDLLATMESFNNRYTVAELEGLRDFRDQVAQLMQKLSLLPEAQADELGNVPAPLPGVENIIPVQSGDKWTCERGAVFDYSVRACLTTNWYGSTRYSPRGKAGLFGTTCPQGTQEIPHYSVGSAACIPNANWALISPERREGINKGGFLSPTYLRSKTPEEQRAEVLGGVPSGDPASGAPSPGAPSPDAPSAPGAVAGVPTAPQSDGTTNPNPTVGNCKSLSPAERATAISRFRSTAKYQGEDANICIAGGFASKYRTAQKRPGTCEYKRTLDLGGGRKTTPCKADEALCNPVLFCVGGKNSQDQFEPVTFCVKRVGNRINRDITESCAAKHAKIIANQEPLLQCAPIDRRWSAAKKREARAACDAAKKVKGEACDPKYVPTDAEFKKIWEELVSQTQKLRDVWCGREDFAALFCRECEIVSDKIYAMNKEATGSGAPEVRAPAQGTPPVDPHPASIDR